MSKSYGNYVGVTDEPEEMFGKLMRIPDAAMDTYYELLLGEQRGATVSPVEAKRALGRRLVARFHDERAAAAAEQHFDRLHKEHLPPEQVEEVRLSRDLISDGKVHLPALVAEHFGMSRSEARRLLEQGGIRLDGESLGVDALDLETGSLEGAVLQVGKRQFRRIVVGK
jgi:tyrosyl-tRNA synthetase